MNINKRFKVFRERIASEVYSEPDSDMHRTLIDRVVPYFIEHYLEDKDSEILDVGCGWGYACTLFREAGFNNLTAITLSDKDVAATRERGIDCYKMDMSFLEFADKRFDVLWARHVLEHSPYPYLTLLEFNRVLIDKGKVYIEVPMPDTPRVWEHSQNHYSVFGLKLWVSLFMRSGFTVLADTILKLNLIYDGKPITENYLAFVLEKGDISGNISS